MTTSCRNGNSEPMSNRPPEYEVMRRHREELELPLEKVCEAVSLSVPYLSRVERGLRAPSVKVADRLADFYARRSRPVDPNRLLRDAS